MPVYFRLCVIKWRYVKLPTDVKYYSQVDSGGDWAASGPY